MHNKLSEVCILCKNYKKEWPPELPSFVMVCSEESVTIENWTECDKFKGITMAKIDWKENLEGWVTGSVGDIQYRIVQVEDKFSLSLEYISDDAPAVSFIGAYPSLARAKDAAEHGVFVIDSN
jgi:hypothetical protein